MPEVVYWRGIVPGATWSEVVTKWIEEMWGEPVPDDADDMSKQMWHLYRETIVAAGRQCPATSGVWLLPGVSPADVHVCRCVQEWSRPHNDHRCGCGRSWVDVNVNVYMYEDGKPF